MKSYRLLKTFSALTVLLIATLGLTSQANAQSTVGEVFVCSFNGDNDMDDLMKVRDLYLKQTEKAGLTAPPAYVWTPIKGDFAGDFLWFSYFQNATHYGEFSDAMATSTDTAGVVAKFEAENDCNSFLFNQDVVFDGGQPPVTSPPAYIVSSACNFRAAGGAAALPDLRSHIRDYLGSTGNYESYVLLERTSTTRTPTTPDIRFFSVHENAATWGARTDAMQASDGGRQLMRHFEAVLDCSTSHWSSVQAVAPAE